jgi:phosphoribosylformylglycinamidine cyclo-ligase
MATGPDQRYQARGASASKSEIHAAVHGLDRGLFPGAFCTILPDALGGDPQHCMVMHADGAGTKSSLAYLAWREGYGESVWEGIAQDALAMNLNDCACVGATGPFVVSNTIGRNARRVPGGGIAAIVRGYAAAAATMASEGIACHLAGGETADVGDLVRTLIADCTVACRLKRSQVIDAARMQPGDAIVGFASTGKARWETVENAGIGSNGLTSARHELLGADYRARYPETVAPETDPSLAYSGSLSLRSAIPGLEMDAGTALLSPTRLFVPLVRDLVAALAHDDLHGLVFCSGGGQTKILKFGAPGAPRGNRYVKDRLFPAPPLFAAIQGQSELAWQEMYMVYNMGHSLEAVVAPRAVDACIAAARACGIAAQVVGRVEQADQPGNEVVVSSAHGTFTYR